MIKKIECTIQVESRCVRCHCFRRYPRRRESLRLYRKTKRHQQLAEPSLSKHVVIGFWVVLSTSSQEVHDEVRQLRLTSAPMSLRHPVHGPSYNTVPTMAMEEQHTALLYLSRHQLELLAKAQRWSRPPKVCWPCSLPVFGPASCGMVKSIFVTRRIGAM